VNKPLAFFLCTLLAVLAAGVFGVIHAEVMWTAMPTFYTEDSFNFNGLGRLGGEAHPRLALISVGFMDKWYLGLVPGMVEAAWVLDIRNSKNRLRTFVRMASATLGGAVLGLTAGALLGWFHDYKHVKEYWLPYTVTNWRLFVAVDSANNLAGLGGLVGIIAAYFIARSSLKKQYAT
jgi:hypothetical protein